MIKKKETQNKGIEIDLTGPQGNAFYLLGFATKLGKTLGMDWSSICDEMRSGDYENLVKVFDNNFGHLVTLYR